MAINHQFKKDLTDDINSMEFKLKWFLKKTYIHECRRKKGGEKCKRWDSGKCKIPWISKARIESFSFLKVVTSLSEMKGKVQCTGKLSSGTGMQVNMEGSMAVIHLVLCPDEDER